MTLHPVLPYILESYTAWAKKVALPDPRTQYMMFMMTGNSTITLWAAQTRPSAFTLFMVHKEA